MYCWSSLWLAALAVLPKTFQVIFTNQLDHARLSLTLALTLQVKCIALFQVNQVCLYKYTSEQQQFGTNQGQAITVQATVETLCNSGELHYAA